MSEYREHGEWALTVRGADPATTGEWSVTAENSLGSSTRDWRLRVRPGGVTPKPENMGSGCQVAAICVPEENNEYSIRAHMENKTESTIALRKTFEQVTDALNITGGQVRQTKKLDDEASVEDMSSKYEDILSKSPAEVDPAPAPGSLADREHRKWMEAAVSLRNNPYSKENIDKRRLRRSSSFLGTREIQE